MLPRPDHQSFTKFLLSAGVFLMIAAFVLPGLILRDTGVLEVSKVELRASTSVAKQELERRQRVARDAGKVAPFLGGALLLSGALLVGFGLPRLRHQERKDEERSAMEMDKLRAELEPQSDDEKEERLKADVAEDRQAEAEAARERQPLETSMAEPSTVPPPMGDRADSSPGDKYFNADLRSRAKLEAEVLQHIDKIAPPAYELQAHVKVAGTPSLLLDGLLVSKVDQLPDILIEIKISKRFIAFNTGNRLAEQVAHLLRYRTRLERDSIAWLIFVVDEPVSGEQRRRLDQVTAEFETDVRISVVTPASIPRLALPIESA
jgi:hypothetical protein